MVRMARNQRVQVTQTNFWLHVPQIKPVVLGAIYCDADQAWIFPVTGSRVYEMYVHAKLNVFELWIGFEKVSQVQQSHLTDNRSVELFDLGCGTFLLAQHRRYSHIRVRTPPLVRHRPEAARNARLPALLGANRQPRPRAEHPLGNRVPDSASSR